MKHLLWLLLLAFPLAVLPGCGGQSGSRTFRIAFMPKLKPIPYFQACEKGAREAAQELNIPLDYNGPNQAEVEPQIDLINQWTASGEYGCIAVACNDPDRIAPALRDARDRGILVITYDADTQEDARSFFVNQATYDDVAQAMVDAMAEELEPKATGKVALLTSWITAPNQSQWARRMKAYAREKYPQMELLPETEHGEDRQEGIKQAKAIIQRHARDNDLKGIIGLTSVAVPAAAEAVRQEGKRGQIKVGGVSTPKDMRDYVQDGTVTTFILWNPVDLGYLTVYVADLARQGKMPENGEIEAGRLGKITVRNREVLLGKPMRFTKENIDRYDF